MPQKPHHPKKLALNLNLNYNLISEELNKSQYALGLLQGSQRKLYNSDLLISPLTAKEAAVSSKIEGTQSTVSDMFLLEAGGKPKYADAREVLSYRQATEFAIKEIDKGRNISAHLIKTLQQILLSGVRHTGNLGEFRKKPVWIAEKRGDPIEKATYIPPEFHFVIDYMDNLLVYLEKGKEDSLIKAGIMHYQFEAVHPFEDGNGRIGRLLIPLILYSEKKLSSPILYISGYLDEHRDEYIDTLHAIDNGASFEVWIKFFLTAVSEQLGKTQDLIEKMDRLYSEIRSKFPTNKSPNLIPFLEFLFRMPIFTIPDLLNKAGIKYRPTAKSLIQLFKNGGYIVELSNFSGRAKLYAFKPLLNILH